MLLSSFVDRDRKLTSGFVARAVLIFLGFVILMRFLWVARSIFLTLFLGVLFALPLSAGADWLQKKWRLPRVAAVILLVVVFLGLMTVLGAVTAPTLREQTRQLQLHIPEAVDLIQKWVGSKNQEETKATTAGGSKTAEKPEPASSAPHPRSEPPGAQESTPAGGKAEEVSSTLARLLGKELGALVQILFPFVSGVLAALTGLLLILFTAIYLAVSPGSYVRGALFLFPEARRDRAREIAEELGESLRRWLVARLLAMIAIGAITTAGLALLDVKSALALGVLAGILEFVPFFGPIASSIPAISVALIDSPGKAAAVIALFIVIQQLEGNVITPLLLKKRVDVPPALTIASVAVFGLVFGALGLLVAEPLLVTGLVISRNLLDPEAHESAAVKPRKV